MAGKPVIFDEDALAIIQDAVHRIMSMRGDGVTNGPAGISIRWPKLPKPNPLGGGSKVIWFKATASASLASASIAVGGGSSVSVIYQWKYGGNQVQRSGNGWADVTGGVTTTTSDTIATVASMEAGNGTSYVNGVDITAAGYGEDSRPTPLGGVNVDQSHGQDVIVPALVETDAAGARVVTLIGGGGHAIVCDT